MGRGFNYKCWGRGLWAWSAFPSVLYLTDHVPAFGAKRYDVKSYFNTAEL